MRVSTILSLGLSLVSLTTAAPATADAPAIKALLGTLNTNIAAIDKNVVAITEANIATQAGVVIKSIETLNAALIESANQIKATKALGLVDLASLASSLTPIQKSAQGLLSTIITKRTIIVKGKQVENIGAGLKVMQSGISTLTSALLTQLPANLAAQIPKVGPSLPEGANLDTVKLQDTLFEVSLAVFKGTDTPVMVSGSIWPLA